MPIYDFPFIVKSSLYHICHRLLDYHIGTFKILPISVFDLEIEGQDDGLRLWANVIVADYTLDAILIRLQFGEKNSSSISNRFCVVQQ